jgi:hypothetical protein
LLTDIHVHRLLTIEDSETQQAMAARAADDHWREPDRL